MSRARTPLFRWMVQHHDALAAEFGQFGALWDDVADRAEAAGVCRRGGARYTPANCRRTWYGVRQWVPLHRAAETAAAEQRAAEAAIREPAPVTHSAPVASLVRMHGQGQGPTPLPDVPDDAEGGDRPRRKLTPSTPR